MSLSAQIPILAIDYGSRFIGLAIYQGIVPTPLAVIHKEGAEQEIINIINEYKVKTLLFGLPLNAAGVETAFASKVRKFAARLSKRASCQIVYADEHLSSSDATRYARSSEQRVDSIAAAIILESYLNLK